MLSRNLLRGLSLTLLSLAAHGQNLALRGGTIHTMAGEAIEDGVILVQNGKIAAIGPAADVTIPADIRLVLASLIRCHHLLWHVPCDCLLGAQVTSAILLLAWKYSSDERLFKVDEDKLERISRNDRTRP